MRSRFIALLAAAVLATWGLLAGTLHASAHAGHEAGPGWSAEAPGHAEHAPAQDCCAVPGGMQCISAGVLTEPLATRPEDAALAAILWLDAEPLSARNPNPAAKPPRA